MRKVLIIIISCMLLVSCATAPKPGSDKEKMLLLNQELERWQNFKLTGLADIQYQSFSIRRPCVIALSDGKFRFDILDSGFLGMGSGVFMSAFADHDGIQYRMPGTSKIELLKTDTETEAILNFLTQKWADILAEVKDAIIETNRAEIFGITLSFSDRMRLVQVASKEENIRVNFVYDSRENLTEINISAPIIRKLLIQVDKIEHNDIVVTPLVKP